MRIIVDRSGSGWGGYVSKYLIDTDEKIMINLYKCFDLTKDGRYFKYDIVDFRLSEFPEGAKSSCELNIALLEKLANCDLHEEECMVMDHQIDRIYILIDGTNGSEVYFRCVYDTDYAKWPNDEEILAEILRMLKLCI